MKVFDLYEENDLDSYMSREVPALEGDEPQSLTQEEAENAEVVIATLNVLPLSWDSFMRGMCAKRK